MGEPRVRRHAQVSFGVASSEDRRTLIPKENRCSDTSLTDSRERCWTTGSATLQEAGTTEWRCRCWGRQTNEPSVVISTKGWP